MLDVDTEVICKSFDSLMSRLIHTYHTTVSYRFDTGKFSVFWIESYINLKLLKKTEKGLFYRRLSILWIHLEQENIFWHQRSQSPATHQKLNALMWRR